MQLGGIYCTSRRSPCKFNDEHIMDENQRASVATEFVSNLSKIIDVLSDASIDAGAHVRETFNPPPVLAERKRMSTFSRTTRSKPPPSARRLWCVMSASRWRSSFAMLEQLPGKLPLFLRRKGGVEGREGVRFAVAGEVALRGCVFAADAAWMRTEGAYIALQATRRCRAEGTSRRWSSPANSRRIWRRSPNRSEPGRMPQALSAMRRGGRIIPEGRARRASATRGRACRRCRRR